MNKVITVYHSQYGHTKLQAQAVHEGVKSVVGDGAILLTAEEATARLDEFDTADGILFGSPTYMGSMTAGMKTFVEASSKKWFTHAWKDKVSGVFTNSTSFSGDKVNTLVGLMINAMQHGMIHVSLGMLPAYNEPEGFNTLAGPGPGAHNRSGAFIGAMATSFQLNPGDGPSPGDLETARLYGKRVAEVAVRLANSKR